MEEREYKTRVKPEDAQRWGAEGGDEEKEKRISKRGFNFHLPLAPFRLPLSTLYLSSSLSTGIRNGCRGSWCQAESWFENVPVETTLTYLSYLHFRGGTPGT